MLVSKLIDAAMRKINVTASGETPKDAERQDGLEALQSMLRSWSAEKINIYASVHETHTLVASTYVYTWGSGGDIGTGRPHKVTGVSIDDSQGTTHSVSIIGESRYRQISTKSTVSRPTMLFVKYLYPLVELNLYPVPSAGETLNLESFKPFDETSSFESVSDTIQVPVNYEEPIIYNLAVRLAPEFGKSVSREVASTADLSYRRLMNLNSGNYVEPVHITLPSGSRGRYSINSDA